MKVVNIHRTNHIREKFRLYHRARLVGSKFKQFPLSVKELNEIPYWKARMIFLGYNKGVADRAYN